MRIIKGDLLELAEKGEFDAIIHGCNCFNTMGAGIALQIAKAYSNVELVDKLTSMGDSKKLGNFTFAKVKRDKFFFNVYNAYTQYQPGKHFKNAALKIVLFKLNKLLPTSARIGMPQIGCGIGGGIWEEVRGIINTEFAGRNVTVVEYEKPIKV